MADSIWIPQKKQAEVLLAHCYEKLIGGSRGGGKTDTGVVWLVEPRYIQNHNYRALILRKNYEDLKDWIDRAKKHFAAYGGVAVGAPTVFRFPNGVEFRMGHLKDRKSYEKYLGHEYQKILVEELTSIPDQRYYIEIMGSLRSSDPTLDPCIMSTTNPGGPGHVWVKKRFVDYLPHGKIFYPEDLGGRGRIFIPMSLDDNKILREADPGYELYLEGLKDVDPILYKRWRKGDWDIFEGQFFDGFDRDIHVVEPYIPKREETKRYIVHFDYGFSAPSAVYWTKKDTQGKICTFRELYKTGLTYRALAREILAIQKGEEHIPEMYICDPAIYNKKTEDSGKTAKEIFAEEGITLTPGNNSRLDGANLIRELLAGDENQYGQREPILTITSNCVNLITQMANLIRSDRNVEDIADGQEDHGYDGGRYGWVELGKNVADLKMVSGANRALHRKKPGHEQLAP